MQQQKSSPPSSRAARDLKPEGLSVPRRYTAENDPYEAISWERRDAVILGPKGVPVFAQKDVEVPSSWSQQATNIVASKYFRGHLGSPDRESSVRQLVHRVADTIAAWGATDRMFADEDQVDAFRDELAYILLNQRAAFNSPVWFNVGVSSHPQCSACFINSVEDSMESIMDLARTEALLFKGGSGAGSNLSQIRSSMERLSGSGQASGPVSFMKGFDAFAGVIKSGGKTRRAAKMVILDVEHPDILEFIRCKADEERKAWALIDAGFDGAVDGEAYGSVSFQNANHSARVSDAFMEAVDADADWSTRFVTTGAEAETHRARHIFRAIAEAAWSCGDPGLQFDTTINRWNTCSGTAPIRASNPCSEYMFLDDTACNLASLNLLSYRENDGGFDVDGFTHDCRLVLTAQEILVGNSSYPTEAITRNSHRYRTLGIGYANLGALLMSLGLPYDSDAGRALAGAITALLTGSSYAHSARMAAHLGPFPGYDQNAQAMGEVIQRHVDATQTLQVEFLPSRLIDAARQCWTEAQELGIAHGYRNAQVSVLAPTGTIAFMMDCATTGIEPDLALVKYKSLVGGGSMKIVNTTVPLSLQRLGYTDTQREEIQAWINEHETIEGAPHLRAEHVPIFDCAFRPANGVRSIGPMGHVRMMAAAQPFLSGAISKTVNLQSDATVDDIEAIYMEAWRAGLKALAIYRDGCKRVQPLNTSKTQETEIPTIDASAPRRRRLPDERAALTHKFTIGGHEGYLTVGLFEDGTPGELFVRISKEGSTISGLMDAFATSVSIMLQYGVPLDVLVHKFSGMRFEPEGWTSNSDIKYARSVTDYIARWMALKFLGRGPQVDDSADAQKTLASTDSQPILVSTVPAEAKKMGFEFTEPSMPTVQPTPQLPKASSELGVYAQGGFGASMAALPSMPDGPPCNRCGNPTVPDGTCHVCRHCGDTTGCGG